MAGKEVRGVEHSDADLFQGRPWLFTSEPPSWLREWVAKIGARVRVTTPEEHDRLVALASHLPQLLSSALASVTEPARDAAGPGLESMTRLAASPYAIWQDIVETNRDEILAAYDELLATMHKHRRALATGEERFLFHNG